MDANERSRSRVTALEKAHSNRNRADRLWAIASELARAVKLLFGSEPVFISWMNH